MAKTGIKYPVAALGDYPKTATETNKGEPAYSDGFIIGRAMLADIDVKFSSNPLYADNAIAEDEYVFESGTIKLGVDDILEKSRSVMFGHSLETVTGDEHPGITCGADDTPPYLGVGFYKTGTYNNKKYYEVTWLWKTKFTPPKESAKTSEGKTSWQTDETEGGIYTVPTMAKSPYKFTKRFDTEQEAIDWLNNKAGITPETETTASESTPVTTE